MPLILRRIALIVLTVLLATSSLGTAWADDRVFVDFFVNGVQRDPVLAVLRDGDVLLPIQALQSAHIPLAARYSQEQNAAQYQSLTALQNELTYRFDSKKLRLDVALSSSALPKSTLDLNPQVEGDALPTSARSLVMNYAVHVEPGTGLTGSVEQRYSAGGAGTIENTIGRSFDGHLARGLTSLTLDAPTKIRRSIVGDAYAGTGDLGGSAIIGGISVQRAFDTNPYAIRFPLPSVDATVLQPSQANVVVNGQVVKSIDLQPGTYNLNDLPVNLGIDHAQVVLRDAFGAKTIWDSTVYGSAGLLRKGLTDYAYSAGMLRVNPESPADAYHGGAVLGRYRIGLSDFTTAGARFESGPRLWSGGIDYDALFRFADIHFALARSNSAGIAGTAATLAYSGSSLFSSYSLVTRFQSADYSNTSERIQDDRPLIELDASGSRRLLENTALNFGLRYANYRDSGISRQVSAGVTQRMRDFNVSLEYARSRWNTVTLGVGVPLGPSSNQTTTLQTGPSQLTSTTIVHTPSSQLEPGYNVTLGANGQTAPFAAGVQFGLPAATLALQGSGNLRGGARFSGSADLAGAVERIDGKTLFSQPVRDAYAVVEAPGAAGAEVFLNNRYAGRTNHAGYAVVPFLASYQVNRVSVSQNGLAADEVLTGEDQALKPAFHGAGIVRLQNHVEHGVVGNVVRKNGKPLQYGELDLHLSDGRTLSSPTDDTGRFYFENLSPGRYNAEATDNTGTCRLEFDVPQFSGTQHAVGTLSCDR
jgi:outer membrane usher protein